MNLKDAKRHAGHLCDVYPTSPDDEHIGVITRFRAGGTEAFVTGHLQYDGRWFVLDGLSTSCAVVD